MRRVVLLGGVFAACGGSAPPQASEPATSPARNERPPKELTPRDMLRSFPENTHMLIVFDVVKLRRSPTVTRAWKLVRDLPQITEMLDVSCGVLADVEYAVVAMIDAETQEFWGWLRGLRRDAKLTCAKSVAEAKQKQTKRFSQGAYDLETSTTSVVDLVWHDTQTVFMHYAKAGSEPLGEAHMRRVMDAGELADNETMMTLLDHVDFEAGVVMAIDGVVAKQPTVTGIALAVEADTDVRAQAYVLFDHEDRARDMQGQYETALSQLEQAGLIEASEVRADGRGVAVSAGITGVQFDWWLAFGEGRVKDPSAPPPPPPPPPTR